MIVPRTRFTTQGTLHSSRRNFPRVGLSQCQTPSVHPPVPRYPPGAFSSLGSYRIRYTKSYMEVGRIWMGIDGDGYERGRIWKGKNMEMEEMYGNRLS